MIRFFIQWGLLCGLLSCNLLVATENSGDSHLAKLDLHAVFMGSPWIYIALLCLSVLSFAIWIYTLCTLRLSAMMPSQLLETVRGQLAEQQFDKALETCLEEKNFTSRVLGRGLASRKYGPELMMSAMHAEGRRLGSRLWQRISLLNEIAVIAPMLGLLGTVLGLFFAFYDMNRTAESLDSVFDGLGIAVGTTVAGLIVAIVAMIFYTLLKFKVTHLLNTIECEAYSVISTVEPQPLFFESDEDL